MGQHNNCNACNDDRSAFHRRGSQGVFHDVVLDGGDRMDDSNAGKVVQQLNFNVF